MANPQPPDIESPADVELDVDLALPRLDPNDFDADSTEADAEASATEGAGHTPDTAGGASPFDPLGSGPGDLANALQPDVEIPAAPTNLDEVLADRHLDLSDVQTSLVDHQPPYGQAMVADDFAPGSGEGFIWGENESFRYMLDTTGTFGDSFYYKGEDLYVHYNPDGSKDYIDKDGHHGHVPAHGDADDAPPGGEADPPPPTGSDPPPAGEADPPEATTGDPPPAGDTSPAPGAGETPPAPTGDTPPPPPAGDPPPAGSGESEDPPPEEDPPADEDPPPGDPPEEDEQDDDPPADETEDAGSEGIPDEDHQFARDPVLDLLNPLPRTADLGPTTDTGDVDPADAPSVVGTTSGQPVDLQARFLGGDTHGADFGAGAGTIAPGHVDAGNVDPPDDAVSEQGGLGPSEPDQEYGGHFATVGEDGYGGATDAATEADGEGEPLFEVPQVDVDVDTTPDVPDGFDGGLS